MTTPSGQKGFVKTILKGVDPSMNSRFYTNLPARRFDMYEKHPENFEMYLHDMFKIKGFVGEVTSYNHELYHNENGKVNFKIVPPETRTVLNSKTKN